MREGKDCPLYTFHTCCRYGKVQAMGEGLELGSSKVLQGADLKNHFLYKRPCFGAHERLQKWSRQGMCKGPEERTKMKRVKEKQRWASQWGLRPDQGALVCAVSSPASILSMDYLITGVNSRGPWPCLEKLPWHPPVCRSEHTTLVVHTRND